MGAHTWGHTPIRDTQKTHLYRHTQTQPHFTAPWHKMGFRCLSRGGPMATEGHMKRWALYNHWCQIGCQLQHKWLSITSAPRVKRPLYRWLDFRRQRKSLLPPAHSTALQERLHTEACIHAYMHKADTHNIHPYGCKHSCRNVKKHTHLHCNSRAAPSSNTSQMKPWASSKHSYANTSTRSTFFSYLLSALKTRCAVDIHSGCSRTVINLVGAD